MSPPTASSSSSSRIQFHHFPEIDSTHTFVERTYGSFDPSILTCVSADYQTAGRGTNKRVWSAPKGKNLLTTFYFTLPDRCKAQAASFLQVAAVSFLDTVRRKACRGVDISRLQFRLKWPNDVMCNEKKMGGILSRMVADPVRHSSSSRDVSRLIQGTKPSAGGGMPVVLSSSSSTSAVNNATSNTSAVELSPIIGTNVNTSFVQSPNKAEHSVVLADLTPPSLTHAAAATAGSSVGGAVDGVHQLSSPTFAEKLSKEIPGTQSYSLPIENYTRDFYYSGSSSSESGTIESKKEKRIGMILSLGLNVNLTQDDLDLVIASNNGIKNFAWPPTSLRQEIGNPVLQFEVDRVKELIAFDLYDIILKFEQVGYLQFLRAINDNLLYENEKIVFAPRGREHTDRVEGIFRGLDDEGWLILESLVTGGTEKYCSGELCPPVKVR
ncbi:unnamed protein product [Amoebophrya sp. A120]|nr:unnamed protein product [Amoebophrya sp. A120]|eukprot:GSA120T00012103001.1